MATPTFRPPIGPSPGTSQSPTISLYETDFGDGYSQPTPKGINHIKDTVSLKWDALTLEQKDVIIDFFRGRAGYQPFYYQPFGMRSTGLWTCKEWSATTEGGIWSISATFVQSFAT